MCGPHTHTYTHAYRHMQSQPLPYVWMQKHIQYGLAKLIELKTTTTKLAWCVLDITSAKLKLLKDFSGSVALAVLMIHHRPPCCSYDTWDAGCAVLSRDNTIRWSLKWITCTLVLLTRNILEVLIYSQYFEAVEQKNVILLWQNLFG